MAVSVACRAGELLSWLTPVRKRVVKNSVTSVLYALRMLDTEPVSGLYSQPDSKGFIRKRSVLSASVSTM